MVTGRRRVAREASPVLVTMAMELNEKDAAECAATQKPDFGVRTKKLENIIPPYTKVRMQIMSYMILISSNPNELNRRI